MSFIVKFFLSLPFWVRVAILLFILIFVVWQFCGRPILWGLSGIPFLLRKIFHMFYLLIEMPVAALHKKFGMTFGKIDDRMSQIGENIDKLIERWYKAWHMPQKASLKKSLLIYVICIVFIAGPSLIHIDNRLLKTGEILYVCSEAFCINWLEEHGWYNPTVQTAWDQEEQEEDEEAENDDSKIVLIVAGIEDFLLVRDIPSIQDYTVLESLQNNDRVIWNGEMVFAEADEGHIEPWVKVVTVDGVQGWSRLYYLYPEQYANMEFYMAH